MKRAPTNGTSCGGILALAITLTSLEALTAEPFPAPAKVEKPEAETELANIRLSPEAEQRLGIETTLVELRGLARTRLFGGEITLPAQIRGRDPSGQSVFAILPSLMPAELVRLAQSQIDADGQIEQARLQLNATRLLLARAEQMRHDRVGTERAVDEARAQVGFAEAGLRTAQARRELLGAAILAVSNPPKVWIRVPVYVGDLAKLDTVAEARVSGLADSPGASTLAATPVRAPPSANAATATADMFYEISNRDGVYRLGQRVGVQVPLLGQEETLVVPWSAIVHDVLGGSWVYERTAPLVYFRRRVQVARVVGDLAALASGVKAGASVVFTGAAELFGTEFGIGK